MDELDNEYAEWLDHLQQNIEENNLEWEEPLPEGCIDHNEEDRIAYEMEKVSIRAHRPSEY